MSAQYKRTCDRCGHTEQWTERDIDPERWEVVDDYDLCSTCYAALRPAMAEARQKWFREWIVGARK